MTKRVHDDGGVPDTAFQVAACKGARGIPGEEGKRAGGRGKAGGENVRDLTVCLTVPIDTPLPRWGCEGCEAALPR